MPLLLTLTDLGLFLPTFGWGRGKRKGKKEGEEERDRRRDGDRENV
jgi:hypothetical protein